MAYKAEFRIVSSYSLLIVSSSRFSCLRLVGGGVFEYPTETPDTAPGCGVALCHIYVDRNYTDLVLARLRQAWIRSE